ncbi:MAG: hypothetical protein M1822_009061, partial [Bathelium mastoideum]
MANNASRVTFLGPENQGLQVGYNNGHVETHHYYPTGTLPTFLSFRATLTDKTPLSVERPETPPSPSSTFLPFPRDPDFVEREELCDHIHRKCTMPGSWTALVGLGGVGKSQLAIEQAHRTREQSPETWVFWVHASNAARFEQDYRDIADTVKIQGRHNPKANIFKLIRDWLHGPKRKWLLIFDNIDDARFLLDPTQSHIVDGTISQPLRDYLPRSQNGSVLITSRNTEAARKLVEERDITIVEPMDQVEALTLLKRKLDIYNKGQELSDLAAALEYMPLAIIQAAAYIFHRASRYSVRQYLEEFRKSDRKKTSLLDYEEGQLRRDSKAKNSIITIWQISFDYICQNNPSAADLLSLMSFFDRQGIPEDLLRYRLTEAAVQERSVLEDRSDTNENEDDRSDSSEIDERDDDILILRNHHFITIGTNSSTFEMHSLVQLAMRKWLEANSQLEKWKQQFIKNLYAEFPTGEFENWAKCQALFPHAQSMMAQQPEGHDSLIDWASILYKAAWYAWKQGKGKDAEAMVMKSMKTRMKLFDQNHNDTVSSIAMYGLICQLQGRWKEAEELEVRVMETSLRVLGEEHPSTLISMANLASTYRNQGRWKEAEELFVRVMETRKRVLGEEHPDTLTSIANLASTYWNQGRWKEAEELDVRVMETSLRVLGEEHPDTLSSMANLASTYRNQGRWKEAEELFVRVMETRKRVLGEEHPDTLSSIANLASTYWNQGRWKEAQELFVRVMETNLRVLGEEHPDTLSSIANLASTYWNQGRWKEAEELF